MLRREEIVDLYRRRAGRYDFTAQLYYLVGFREWAYREKAVEALALKRGDTVVEIGCGTGLNFALLEEAVGAEGKIIGVDMTDSMLSVARERVWKNRWSNVELVQSDAATFPFPRGVDGIISTFAITLVPEYEAVIRAGSEALVPQGRFVVLDFKLPSNWLRWLAPLLVLALRPFGVSLDLATRHPWEAMQKHLTKVSVTEQYGGIAYLAVGKKSGLGRQRFGLGKSAGSFDRAGGAKMLSVPGRGHRTAGDGHARTELGSSLGADCRVPLARQ